MLTRQYGPKSLLLNVEFFQHLNESVTLRIKAALKVERSKEELMKYPVPCSIQMSTATNISFLYRLNDYSVFSFHVLCIKLPKHKETHWVGLLGQN